MKHTIVEFGEQGARIKRVADVESYLGKANVLIDPDLSLVRGVPPHEWAIVGGKLARKESGSKARGSRYWLFWLKVAALSAATSLLVRFL